MHRDPTSRRYVFVSLLNVLITITEFGGGLWSGSLALLSDAIHNLSDVGAVILSFAAHLLSQHSRNASKTFGYQRAETLAAFTNGVILIIVSLILFGEAVQRFWQPAHVHGQIMLFVALIGLVVNGFSMLLMHQRAKSNLNVRSTFIHMMSDALASVAVVIGAFFIYFWQVSWLDPLLTILVSLFVLHEAYKITLKAANILMESNPDIDLDEVYRIVLAFSAVKNIHHVHLWRYSDRYIMLDAHLNVAPDLTAVQFENLCQQIGQQLRHKLGINHINFQAECRRGENAQMIVKHGQEN